ncbi:MAG: hypothetical protein IT358_14910, partial [Gemmatimonadaceae bacterium]|nr:hypothetical protein [Gemmatimonadaceae bacterium]
MSPMSRVPRRVALVARFLVPVLAALAPLASRAHAQLAIRDVTVIDGTGAPPRTHQTVLVVRDRIAAVGDTDSIAIPPSARIIDGRGKFLLPGFIDVHAHTSIGPVALDTSARPPRMTARE